MIGIIVDGQGDFGALKIRFSKTCKILKTDGPRSHTVSPEFIVSQARKQIAILRDYHCIKVILLVDFEERTSNYNLFLKHIENYIESCNLGLPVYAASPNKMIENWYLADIEFLSKRKKFLKNNLKQKNFEGKHGKKELRKCFKKGYTYIETKHGPQLFIILRFKEAKKNSPSFSHFLNLLRK